MKKIKNIIMKLVSKIVLNYSNKAVFSSCSNGRIHEIKISDELKNEIKNAIKEIKS